MADLVVKYAIHVTVFWHSSRIVLRNAHVLLDNLHWRASSGRYNIDLRSYLFKGLIMLGKVKGEVCIRAKWPIRLELFLVSVAWSGQEYFYFPLDEPRLLAPDSSALTMRPLHLKLTDYVMRLKNHIEVNKKFIWWSENYHDHFGRKRSTDFLNNLELMFNSADLHHRSWHPIWTWDAITNMAAIP